MKKLTIFLALIMVFGLLPLSAPAQAAPPVRVWGLIGPTGMSLAPLMAEQDPVYEYQLAAAPEELVGTVVSGNYDIAALPTNLAAVLYQKTKGQLQMLAINTLGVLYVLEKGESLQSLEDLSGKTLTLSGQGAVPEYVINFVLKASGIVDAKLDYKSEHNEVSTLAASGLANIVMLPQPMVTALMLKDPSFRIALDITQEFSKAAELSGLGDAILSMGCLVVRSEFAKEQPEALARFMELYEASVDYVNEQPELAARDIVAAGILPSEVIAEKAIPLSNIVYIAGDEMKPLLDPFFEILFKANPASVGGALPDDHFYYRAE